MDDALRAAATRRAGGRVPGLPTLETELGVPFAPEPDERVMDDAAELRAALDAAPADPYEALGGQQYDAPAIIEATAAPLWLVPKLGIAPGRYTGLSGYASAGKTWFAQGLAIAVATGRPFCGLDVRQGRVLHLDHEQGGDMTRERYQLLGLPGDAALRLVSFPDWRMSDKNARRDLEAAARASALIVVDNLRASIDGDESSSEVRRWLDMMSALSDETGCTMLVIHHARKGAGDEPEDIYKARGSSAILDAAGCFWHLQLGERDADTGLRDPSILSQTKPGRHPPGGVLGPSEFIVQTAADGSSVKLSLGLTSADIAKPDLSRMRERVISAIQANKGRIRSANRLVEVVAGRKTDVLQVMSELQDEGLIMYQNGALACVS